MPKSSGLAAQTKVDVAARPILNESTFLPQGSLYVDDENWMIPRSQDTYNPQVDMEVSVLVGSLSIPQLTRLDRYSCELFRQSLSIDAADFHLRAWVSAP